MCHQFKDYRQVFIPWKKSSYMEPLGIHFCDSGKLFSLLSTLGKYECAKLHTKVNEYFFRTIGVIGIIAELWGSPPSIKIKAIGRVPLQEVLVFEANCDLVQRLRVTKGPSRFEKGHLEGRLYCELENILKEEYQTKFFNCLFLPIEHPLEKEKYTYYVGLVNFKDFDDCDDAYNGLVTECMRHCFAMLRSAANYEEEKLNSTRCTTMLETYIKILTASGSTLIYDQVQRQAMNVFNAKNCTVFLSHPEYGLVAKVQTYNTDPNTDKAAEETDKILHTTTALKVMKTGKPLQINQAELDPFYSSLNNRFTGSCRTLLSFPLKLDGKLLGVIEVYDKKTASSIFTEEDKELSIPFSNTVAFALEANNIFYHHMDVKAKQQYSDCVFLRRLKETDNEIVKKVCKCEHEHNYHRITDFRFDPRVVPKYHLLCICLRIFETSGLLKRFQIKRTTFVRFLVNVKEAHLNLPFHNWELAFLTLHFVFVCVNQYNLIKDEHITIFEYFTMLIAALCHNLDYRGPTSMFQMTTGTVLGSLYSSPGSINQFHHLSQTLRLMTSPECNILQHIGEERFIAFASLLSDYIINTDLSLREEPFELQEFIANYYRVDEPKDRRLLQYLVLNCAQTCYACKPWSLCRKIGGDCFQEFYRKGDLTHATGVFDIPDFNEDILKLPEMNLNFIERTCLPFFLEPLDPFSKLQQTHEKNTKKSRRLEFLRLFYSNPQKLLSLIKDLYDDSTIAQQRKVNLYLQTETDSDLSFLIELCRLSEESVIKVIGTKFLKTEVRFMENNEFMNRLKQSENPFICAIELLDDTLKNAIISIIGDFHLKGIWKFHFIPVYNPYRKNLILYVCLVNNKIGLLQTETMYGVVGECFRYCQEIIINTMRYEEQRLFHINQKKILEFGICNMDLIENISALVPIIKHSIIDILNAERCNIFIIDGKHLVSCICEHGVAYDTFKKPITNVVIPIGVGIPGTVAQTGVPINCIDPRKDPLYRDDLDNAGRLITRFRNCQPQYSAQNRSVLCFPLMLYGRVYGVVEAHNKSNCNVFNAVDISHSLDLGKIIGIQLYMCLTRKKNWDDYTRRLMIDSLMIETEKDGESELKSVINCSDTHSYEGFVNYMFITTSIPLEHNICCCLHMFEECKLLQNLEIDRIAFVRFLINTRNRQKETSFHGWKHAFNTLHFIYVIVKIENILDSGIITTMECFCMFVAALCHDMESGGSVTHFMPTSGTTLGSLYSSPGSVVQLHSIAQTVRLLNDCGITDDFDLIKFKEFLSLLDQMILDMDLGNHVYSQSLVKTLINESKLLKPPKNRRHYFALLLTCSDLSDFCKPWEYLETRGDEISDAFFTKKLTKECQGLIEFSGLLENIELKKVMLQIHFIKTICEPTFSLLSSVLRQTDRCIESMEYNLKSLRAKQEKVISAQAENY